MFQLRQQHATYQPHPVQPTCLVTIQRNAIATFVTHMNGMGIFNNTDNLGLISTKGEILDESLLDISSLSKENMFHFFNTHEGRKTGPHSVFIYAKDREKLLRKDILHKTVVQRLQDLKAADPQQARSLE